MKIFSFVPSQIESYLAEVVLGWSYSKLCLTAPPSIQEPQYNWNIVERGIKHHKPKSPSKMASDTKNRNVLIMSRPTLMGRHIVFVLSVCQSQFVSTTPLKLLNRISWNLVGSKDTICSCAYYQEMLIAWILWELCPFELRNFPKFTTEAACQRNSSETAKQNFMKLGR
jgi:hypothetical protein